MQRVLITGGDGDLARAFAAAFRSRGDEVSAPGRRALDVADPASVDAFFSRSETPDLLVAAAGFAEDHQLAHTGPDAWDRQLDANLHGAWRCAKAVARGMIRRRSGHLVFVGSHAALHPSAGQSAYAAAKAGLLGLARSLARELGPAGIRVNTLLPGFLETRMTAGVADAHRTAVRRDHCLGRFNTPGAVADFLVHLHHHLPHTSGQVFQLDSRTAG